MLVPAYTLLIPPARPRARCCYAEPFSENEESIPPNVHTTAHQISVKYSPVHSVGYMFHPSMNACTMPSPFFPFPTFPQPKAKYVVRKLACPPRSLRKRHRCHESIPLHSLVTSILFQSSHSVYPASIPQELSTATCVIAFNAPIALFTSSPATDRKSVV